MKIWTHELSYDRIFLFLIVLGNFRLQFYSLAYFPDFQIDTLLTRSIVHTLDVYMPRNRCRDRSHNLFFSGKNLNPNFNMR